MEKVDNAIINFQIELDTYKEKPTTRNLLWASPSHKKTGSASSPTNTPRRLTKIQSIYLENCEKSRLTEEPFEGLMNPNIDVCPLQDKETYKDLEILQESEKCFLEYHYKIVKCI